MFRGGGMGGGGGAFGGQLLQWLAGLADAPSDRLLWMLIGVALVVVLLVLIRRTQPAPARPARRSETCLICSRPLAGRVYVDRYFPNWVACGECFDRQSPARQREYRPDWRQPPANALPAGD